MLVDINKIGPGWCVTCGDYSAMFATYYEASDRANAIRAFFRKRDREQKRA